MNYPAFLVDPQIQASLKTELAAAATQPALWPYLPESPAQLLPSFARYQARLNHLPRRVRRSLQRRWQRSLSALALLLALGQAPPALAATISVDGINCTLIDAITAANTDTATGGCPAGSGADILSLVANSIHTLTQVNNETDGKNGLPVISSKMTIEGHKSTINRAAGSPEFRIFAVAPGGDLTLREATVSGGSETTGGGILNSGGTLTLIRSIISGNNGDGVAIVGQELFPIYITNIDHCVISDNEGHGILNTAHYSQDTININNTTISGNNYGLVVQGWGSFVSLTNSTVSGNKGDGVSIGDYGDGGIHNCTISGNLGDGISVSYAAAVALVDSTVTGNKGNGVYMDDLLSDFYPVRSIISGNGGFEVRNFSGDIDGYHDGLNLIGHAGRTNAQSFDNVILGPGNITATSDGTRPTPLNKILNPVLTLSGGRTRTHNLVKGSPAIDAVTAGCPPPATDQRGVPRPQGAACDIGAVELVLCNGQATTRVGTPANETITGTPQRDIIHSLGGNDQVYGLGGNDVLCGGSGNDKLFGQAGNDQLNGGGGFDACNGGSGIDSANQCEVQAGVP